MKLFIVRILPLLAVLVSLSTFAEQNDLEIRKAKEKIRCENRIKSIQKKIKYWIEWGGSKKLKLGKKVTLEEYNVEMFSKIKNAQISCTDDRYFMGDGEIKGEKTCRNEQGEDGVEWILCNSVRFNKTIYSKQYKLIHHEDAGLAEFEVNIGEKSDYWITNQIVGDFKSSDYKFNPNSAFVTKREYAIAEQNLVFLYTNLLFVDNYRKKRKCGTPKNCLSELLVMAPSEYMKVCGLDSDTVSKFLFFKNFFKSTKKVEEAFENSKTMFEIIVMMENICTRDIASCNFENIEYWMMDEAAIIDSVK